jgi:hypothetical protein
MEQALEAMRVAVRDHDWHRVNLALAGLILAYRQSDAPQAVDLVEEKASDEPEAA